MRLIATDLDGTLLNSQKRISEENYAALANAVTQGAELVIATGRYWEDAKRVIASLDLPYTLISSNGTCIHDKSGNRIYSGAMNPADCLEAFHWLDQEGYYFEATTENGIYAWNHHWECLLGELPVLKKQRPETDTARLQWLLSRQAITKKSSPAYSIDYLDQLKEDYYNILIIAFDVERKERAKKHFTQLNHLGVSSSWAYNVELVSPEDSKGIALQKVCQRLQVPLSEAVALGDHENDLSMLKIAGRGVAMGNGDTAVLNTCSLITETHENNGVALALKKLSEDWAFTGDLRK